MKLKHLATAVVAAVALTGTVSAQQFFRIGTGGTAGTYYPVGGMIANAVSHGSPAADGAIEIGWSINGDLLELSVTDSGVGASLKPVDFDEDSLSGRGLAIINRVADRWWVDLENGTRVNAALTLSR